MVDNPAAESLRVVKKAGEEITKILINDLRLRSNRVLRAIDRAADTIPEYLANEVFGQEAKPAGPGWSEVTWAPLSTETIYKKTAYTQNKFFRDQGDLIASMSRFKVGLAFGRAYVVVNGVRPKSHTNWSNIKVNFNDDVPISMDFFPFLKAGADIKPIDRRFAFGAVMRGMSETLDDQGAARRIVNRENAYRPTIEPTLIYFTKRHLKAVAESEIDKQGLY